jgi:hypothetical protein
MATRIVPTWEFALYPWLLPATMLLKPYRFENLLEMVKNVLRMTASVRVGITTPSNRRSYSSIDGLRSEIL